MIILSSDGTIDVNVDGGDVAAGITACTQYAYGIFEPGSMYFIYYGYPQQKNKTGLYVIDNL